MARFEFTKDLETGNATIDREHKELIAAVNGLMDACSAGQGNAKIVETAKFLNDYVNRHFTHEEELQQKSGYPNYTAHKTFHEGYKKTLTEITAGVVKSGASFGDTMKLNTHIGVLITHIKTEDKKLGAFLNK